MCIGVAVQKANEMGGPKAAGAGVASWVIEWLENTTHTSFIAIF